MLFLSFFISPGSTEAHGETVQRNNHWLTYLFWTCCNLHIAAWWRSGPPQSRGIRGFYPYLFSRQFKEISIADGHGERTAMRNAVYYREDRITCTKWSTSRNPSSFSISNTHPFLVSTMTLMSLISVFKMRRATDTDRQRRASSAARLTDLVGGETEHLLFVVV